MTVITDHNYLVYKLTDPSGKSYIGVSKNLKKRLNDHKNGNKCQSLQASIKFYGFDKIICEILKEGMSKDEAFNYESESIKNHNTLYPLGHNMTTGGLSYKYVTESRIKSSISHAGIKPPNTGKKASLESRRKMAQSQTGKKQSAETIEKRRQKLLGKKRSPEAIEALRERMKGRTFSEETLRKMSEGQKRRFAKGAEA